MQREQQVVLRCDKCKSKIDKISARTCHNCGANFIFPEERINLFKKFLIYFIVLLIFVPTVYYYLAFILFSKANIIYTGLVIFMTICSIGAIIFLTKTILRHNKLTKNPEYKTAYKEVKPIDEK